jgi:8-oxo-dGTP pyrophosphatase MutT (NUDIX family)
MGISMMPKQDVLFKTPAEVFSLRVAGILILNNRILLQRVPADSGYAYPGGHVELGEKTEAAVKREFMEEIGIHVDVKRLLWIGELFFPWGERRCHQISYYYLIGSDEYISLENKEKFFIYDTLDKTKIQLEFSWIDLANLEMITIYPTNTQTKLNNLSDHIETFTYFE